MRPSRPPWSSVAAAWRRQPWRRVSAPKRDDVTLPGRSRWRGSLHPLPETEREIARIFGQFGFVVVESPEVETDALNFQALNIPADHPARDLWDTIYVEPPRGRRWPGR